MHTIEKGTEVPIGRALLGDVKAIGQNLQASIAVVEGPYIYLVYSRQHNPGVEGCEPRADSAKSEGSTTRGNLAKKIRLVIG